MIINKLKISFAASLLIVISSTCLAKIETINYTASQSATAKEIVKKLQSRHYREQKFDDALSRSYLTKYVESLDPSRLFFYQSDIHNFDKHETSFDDYFQKGDLSVPYAMYHVYRERMSDRLESNIALLQDKKIDFTFDNDDEVEIDREEHPFLNNKKEADQLWFKRVKLSLLNLRLAGKTTEEARETLTKRYTMQLKRVQQESTPDVFESVLNALTLLYDPHTNYFSPRTAENFNINMSLSLEGIGAVLQAEDEFTKVVRLVSAGPASKQGQLKPADRIVGVAQGNDEIVDIVGWRLDEVVDLVRGPANSVVRLEVLPAGDAAGSETKIVSIVRAKVKLEDQAAQKAIFELSDGDKIYKVGVIDLPTFYMDFDAYARGDRNYKSTTRDVAKLIEELQAAKVDGIVLDLRNNGGGSLNEAAALTDLFIDQGPVVQIRTPERPIDRRLRSMSRALYRGPLVVMVNRLSASASEIFAGAIQDYSRGLIVGSQTFGKGTVQSVSELKEGNLKLTESKFYRVSGDSTQHRGVIPDIELPFLIDKEIVGESSYDKALPWDQIQEAPHAKYFNFSPILSPLISDHEKRAEKDPDFVFILDQLELINKNKSRKTISLNEKTRKKEKEEIELASMTIENKRRTSKGLKPYANIEEYKKEKDSEEEADIAAQSEEHANKIDVDGDAFLIETGNILVDFIRLTSKQERKTAQK